MTDGLKVVLLGAASPQWGYKITRDILVGLSSDSGLSKRHPVLVLEDVDPENLEKTFRLGQIIAAKLDDKVRVERTTDQRKAIEGADFAVTSLAVGTLEAMQPDIEIPYEYGIFQPVGDTISIGGAIRTARNAPALISIARDIAACAKPGAWLLNLSNPMSALTRAILRETRINAVGLCHEVYGGIGLLGRWLGFEFSEWRRRITFDIAGINHCGWMTSLTVDGQDGFELLRRFLKDKGITEQSKRLYDSPTPELRHENLKMILFLRYGAFPFSGDRHTAEFFQEFLNRETNLGADYGIMLTTIQSRLVDWRGGARQGIDDLLAGRKPVDLTLSQEAVARLIKAIAVDEPFFDTCNLPHRGSELPGVVAESVIERMCAYDGQGAHPVEVRPLPEPLQTHLALHAQIIEDVVEASVTGNRDLMLRALGRDLLLKNMDASRIPEMWDRLASANKEFLHPGFFDPAVRA